MTDISRFGFADDVTFTQHLVKDIGIAAVPGSSFYNDPRDGARQVRFAFCKRDQTLDEARSIRHPLMLHIAEKDQYVKPEAQKKIVAALKPNLLVTIHTYPGMDHAFARIGGAHYDKACADLANGRTSTFFKQHLS